MDGIFCGKNVVSCLVGWGKNSSYYSTTAGIRSSNLLHSMSKETKLHTLTHEAKEAILLGIIGYYR